MLWEVSSTESSWSLKNKPVSKVARGLGEREKNKPQVGRYSKDSDRANYTKVLLQHRAKQVSSWWGAWTSSKGKPNSVCYTWQKLGKKTLVCHACEKLRKGDSGDLATTHVERPEETPACHMWKGQRRRTQVTKHKKGREGDPNPPNREKAREEDRNTPCMAKTRERDPSLSCIAKAREGDPSLPCIAKARKGAHREWHGQW